MGVIHAGALYTIQKVSTPKISSGISCAKNRSQRLCSAGTIGHASAAEEKRGLRYLPKAMAALWQDQCSGAVYPQREFRLIGFSSDMAEPVKIRYVGVRETCPVERGDNKVGVFRPEGRSSSMLSVRGTENSRWFRRCRSFRLVPLKIHVIAGSFFGKGYHLLRRGAS
jgi:hypothetical protein